MMKKLKDNIDLIHTTQLGAERIKRNLDLSVCDVVSWCKDIIIKSDKIYIKGKNWYVEDDACIITVNASSYTIITAHKLKGK